MIDMKNNKTEENIFASLIIENVFFILAVYKLNETKYMYENVFIWMDVKFHLHTEWAISRFFNIVPDLKVKLGFRIIIKLK